MHWQIQPILWLLLIATLALLAIPHIAHPQEPSPAIRRACDSDVRRLCPAEYRRKDSEAIGKCMFKYWPMITERCADAWRAEHSGEKK